MPLGTRILTRKPAAAPPVGQLLFEDDLELNAVDQQLLSARTVSGLGTYILQSGSDQYVFYDLALNQFRPSNLGNPTTNILLLDQATDNGRMAIECAPWLSTSEDSNWIQARLFSPPTYQTNPRILLIYDRTGANANKYRYVVRTIDDTNGSADHYVFDSDTIVNGEPVRFEAKIDSASLITLAFRIRGTLMFGPTQVAFNSAGSANTRAMIRGNAETSLSYCRFYGYDRLDNPVDNVIRVDNKAILIP